MRPENAKMLKCPRCMDVAVEYLTRCHDGEYMMICRMCSFTFMEFEGVEERNEY